MSTLLKDLYSPAFYDAFSETLSETVPSFDKTSFLDLIYNDDFESWEWKQRMVHSATVLHQFLSSDFNEAADQLEMIITQIRNSGREAHSIAYLFLAEYVSLYGLNHFERSISVIAYITQFITCEFAVRPFILKYEGKMMDQMLRWSTHESHHVRRLASEGSRLRLPWGKSIPALKMNPISILPILENLKQDDSEYVRRSVANNLNDISKDHQSIAREIAQKWLGHSKETDAVVKHGCRTFIKQGDSEILALFGYERNNLEVSNFEIITPVVSTGANLEFMFSVMNRDRRSRPVWLAYALYYKKKNEFLSHKVFKISERVLGPGEVHKVTRKQSFRKITTRTFYAGEHGLSVIVNGKESTLKSFELVD